MTDACPPTFSVDYSFPKNRFRPAKWALFAKNQHYCFRKIAERAQFGWIRHKSCAEMTANSTYWKGDRLPDGLGEGKRERKGCFGGAGIGEFYRRVTSYVVTVTED
jgi:hypothetical protein